MKNHFIFSYAGNKREESELITNTLININYLNNSINTIIEPYCGTSAISYYISLKYPKKYKYILNDNNTQLTQLYNMMKNKDECEKLNFHINEIIDKFNMFDNDKERKIYYLKIKNENNIYSWIFINKIYCIVAGLYPPISKTRKIKKFNIFDFPIYNFLNSEQVEIKNIDALEIIKLNMNNNECLMILDPPYLLSDNTCYENPNFDIYEWLNNNNINYFKSKICLILENIWINKLLFKENFIHDSYIKTYQKRKKKPVILLLHKKILNKIFNTLIFFNICLRNL